MSGNFLLDTNIVVALFAEDSSVQQSLLKAEQVFVPSIVIGELYYGAQKSLRREENIVRVDEFAAASSVLGPTIATAKEYGEIKNALFNKGHPIPENDIWIAALTKQHGITLVTRDEHFKEVDGIVIETW